MHHPVLTPATPTTMKFTLLFIAALAMLSGVLGFQVAPRGSLTASRSSARLSHHLSTTFVPRSSTPVAASRRRQDGMIMQFGDGGGPIERGEMPSYEEEQEKEFFKSDLDKAPASEKVKDPLVLITLGWIFGMFALATVFILNGVN